MESRLFHHSPAVRQPVPVMSLDTTWEEKQGPFSTPSNKGGISESNGESELQAVINSNENSPEWSIHRRHVRKLDF